MKSSPDVRPSTVHYPRQLREQWPDPLAAHWAASYPQLFDADDYRITRPQPRKHFSTGSCRS